MKIFLTGASGFIGSNIAKFYQQHDIEFFTRADNLYAKLEQSQPDVIINCAAEIYDKDRMWATNVELVRSCLDYMKTDSKIRMIQLGSSSEYGSSYIRATTESDAIDPIDMYSGTKAIATILCQTYANTHNLDVVVLRPYSPYGPGERPHRLFPNFWRSFRLNQPMKLVNGVHDFCYIDDFVSAVDLILKNNFHQRGEIFNVSSGTEHTNLEVLETFRLVTGRQGNVKLVDKFVTPPVWKCNNEKIRKRYGWIPQFNLEQGIRKFLETADYE